MGIRVGAVPEENRTFRERSVLIAAPVVCYGMPIENQDNMRRNHEIMHSHVKYCNEIAMPGCIIWIVLLYIIINQSRVAFLCLPIIIHFITT